MHIINQAWRNQSASLVQLFISERCQEVKGNRRATFQPLKSLTHSLKKLVEIGWSWTWGGMAQVWFVQMSLLSSSSSSPAFVCAHISFIIPPPNCKCLSVIWGPCRNSEPLSYNCKIACRMRGDSGSECK